MAIAVDEVRRLLTFLELSSSKIDETMKNDSISQTIASIALKGEEFNKNLPKSSKKLIYTLATHLQPRAKEYQEYLMKLIFEDKICNDAQLNAALDYVHNKPKEIFKEDEFNEKCGVGLIYTKEMIHDVVTKVFEKVKDQLLLERYSYNTGKLMGQIRNELKFADANEIKKYMDIKILELLGPKTEDELKGIKKKNKVVQNNSNINKDEKKSVTKEKVDEEDSSESIEDLMKTRTHFHKPGENYTTDGYVVTPNTMNLLKKHLKETGGIVQTRFPPEPNGVLHIGHAKAININFGYAKAHNGKCNLRFDDTNPEKEEEKFFHGIEDVVKWLGYKPDKITYSSSNFQQLFDWAVVLIKKDLAYVCHQKVEEMRGFEVKLSPYRNRPIEESLQLFYDMKNGKFPEGAATLRLKLTLEEGKVDPVAYRIKYVPHHRTGNKWCIYPTYDYTHCLCDSIENITHSLCTKEFQSRRSSYYWLCNALDIYCPVQWEYGRLNVGYTVVSKRKIAALINNKLVSDWDDPRLFTLAGLRRRGVPPEAINKFVAKLGLTGAQMTIDPVYLDAVVRDYLNINAPRTMAVVEPLKVTIENFSDLDIGESIVVADFPGDTSRKESHSISVSNVIFIENGDFKFEQEKGYRRLTSTQSVGLRYLGLVLTFVKEVRNSVGEITEVIVNATKLTNDNKPKAFIHWVSKPKIVEVRLYNRLFKHKNPEDSEQVPNGFLSDCDPDSLIVIQNAMIDNYLSQVKPYDKFQFERIGFFSVDPDSSKNKIIFNRTVALKEDAGKN
ncbi:Probable glutamine--tRNA ligase [Strongyloides ratti]|uniref:Probable glutamine--tRNA ligase n=1 Tax=Strongyloides ratti TaxID=34506 RepID=A0A090L2C7_STRRB|nr:Probable glutamine--tRNA ligase [Strongyloides ratti]CEF63981.1 Probable glutamine--tRNA ligase [Strongyloides ratti]